jgi:DNA-binding MarR family transcriptional regulator
MVTNPLPLSRHSETSKSRLRMWIHLLRATRFIEAEIRDRLRRECDVTLPRFDVMAALYRKPQGMLMSELSRFLMVSNGNVTGIVDRLVENGQVIRAQRDGDRRTWVVRLTPKGLAEFETMAALHEKWVNELLAELAPDEADTLAGMLKDLKTDWEAKK